MERGSPKHVTLTKLRYAAPLNPWISLPGTHFTKPIKLAKDPEHQRQHPVPHSALFHEEQTNRERIWLCHFTMDTSPPRGTSVAHVCLRVNKVQLWPGHAIKSRSFVVLRLWDRSAGRRGSVPGNQASSHSTSLHIIDTPSSSLGWLRETPTIALSWSLLTTCECILALQTFQRGGSPM